MGQGKSWVRQAIATVFSQWHFHLDLLDLWKNELASTSLALFVMGRPDDLATYQKLLAYYEQLITLFAFDTGFDPLVCIYDGEIRSTPWLYEFFSASPIYRDVSDRYYTSKLEDVNTQFTEQFLSNLALFWTVIIPDIFAHMGASAPQAIFESKANKLISLRKTTLANAGDFVKWMSHNYSLALKNYVPFIASPELWRAYNPFIDLYWWTLYGHILCLRAFKAIEASARIKPFIEGQKTVITVNGQEYSEARLTGEGIIDICIPKANLRPDENKICFDSYNVISCVEKLEIYTKFWTLNAGCTNLTQTPAQDRCSLCDMGLTYTQSAFIAPKAGRLRHGFVLWNPGKVRLRLALDISYTPDLYSNAYINYFYYRSYNMSAGTRDVFNPAQGTHYLEIPGVEFLVIQFGKTPKYGNLTTGPCSIGNLRAEILPDDYEIPNEYWFLEFPSIDPCPLTPWE